MLTLRPNHRHRFALRASRCARRADEWRCGADYLAPSADVRAFVESLPGGRENKYVFTNCNETQALEALEALGLRDCFADRVFGAGGMGECC